MISSDSTNRRWVGGAGGSGFSGFGGFEDIFDMFTGGSWRRRQPRQEPDGRRSAADDLQLRPDASPLRRPRFGCKKEFKFQRSERPATDCRGTGAKPGTQPRTNAPTCHGGTGQQRRDDEFVRSARCRRMRHLLRPAAARARPSRTNAPSVRGSGRVRVTRTVTLNVPAGVDDGQNFKTIPGEGEPGRNGGPAGDLYITCTVRPHKYLQARPLRPLL